MVDIYTGKFASIFKEMKSTKVNLKPDMKMCKYVF